MATSSARSRDTIGNVPHVGELQSALQPLPESWGIVFTHPEDFVPLDLEVDRWLVVVQRAFATRSIQPLGLAHQVSNPEGTWVRALSWCRSRQILRYVERLPGQLADVPAVGRFVMIVDEHLRNHELFTYRNRVSLPSPLDFLERADRLRTREQGGIN